MTENMLESLVQNYGFKMEKEGKLPTIDYVYPDFTADGNTEEFRFSDTLRRELSERDYVVSASLRDKKVAYTLDSYVLLEVDKVAPRLGLGAQVRGEINSIYAYDPLLFLGSDEKEFVAYVVKPVIDHSMAWFELTKEETDKVREILEKKAEDKPYIPPKTWYKRIFG